MRLRWITCIGTAMALLAASPGAHAAETKVIRIAQQFAMAFLPMTVMQKQNLVEKHAAALGMPDLEVEWTKVTGVGTLNDLLLSGSVDMVAGSPPGMITLWSKTAGTPQEVRGVAALSSFPIVLTTRNPDIKSIEDYTSASRISVAGGVKVGAAAIMLQMAAAEAYGNENYDKLDPLTVSLPITEATIGLLSGASDFDSVIGPPPESNIQLQDPRIHKVLDSYDMMGPVTQAIVWTTKKFHDANPTVYRAFLAALTEGAEFVNTNRREAVAYYVESTNSKRDIDEMLSFIADQERNSFGVVPNGVTKYAQFMNMVGTIKTAPQSWQDLFFPEIWDLGGS